MCARMRVISDVFKQLKEDDPDTNITMYALRTIVKSGNGNLLLFELSLPIIFVPIFWQIFSS